MTDARTDRELLAGHLAGNAGAFEALAARHLAMMLGACRRLLGDGPDAEDAAQAAFLVLLGRARGLAGGRGDLGAWLHRVAGLTARTVRRDRAVRLRHEREAAAMHRAREAVASAPAELPGGLDAALDALPAEVRQALVLCYFEGLSQREAAGRLAVPASTVAMRCSRGLEQLRGRLAAADRRRFGAAALGALLLESSARAAGSVPAGLLPSVVSAAKGAAAGAAVAAISEGVLKMMFWSKAKMVAVAAAAVLALAIIGPLALRAAGGTPERPTAPGPVTVGPTQPGEPVAPFGGTPAPAPAPAERPAVTEADRTEAVKGANAFGVDLYKRLRSEDDFKGKNMFFSPYSITTALGMTYAGARENTAAVMKKTLHYTLPDAKLHAAMGGLTGELNAAGKEGAFQLSVANRLWGQKGFRLLPEFLGLVERDYGAGLEPLDFGAEAGEPARVAINTWVEKQTQDKIKDLIPKGVFNAETVLVLTNAVYFKADWVAQFKKEITRDMPFRPAADKEVKVPTMYQRAQFGYAETDDLQLLEMNYLGERTSMVVLLPRKAEGLAALEDSLSAESLGGLVAKAGRQEVEVYLPKFKFSSGSVMLKKTLSAMGMGEAFARRVADFSGMNGIKPPADGCMYIQEAVHKAFVAVDEKGTEAAAATAVIMGATASVPPPAPTFRADHPFVFLIRDRVSGAVLFMGRVSDPAQG